MDVRTKAVIFDMDGVITHTMPDHYKVWRKIFAREGINVSHLEIYKREGQRGIHSVKEIFKLNKKPITSQYAKDLLKQKERLFKKIAKRRFIPGVRSFLRMLKRQKFHLALVTGTSRHEVFKILPSALTELFDVIVTGSDVKNGKPHPEPFIKALQKLQMNPRGAVVIENAPFGIASAKTAGLRCFAVETSLPRSYLRGADRTFKTIRDLKKETKFLKI